MFSEIQDSLYLHNVNCAFPAKQRNIPQNIQVTIQDGKYAQRCESYYLSSSLPTSISSMPDHPEMEPVPKHEVCVYVCVFDQ